MHWAISRAASAIRGPGRTTVSESSGPNTHTRCSRTALMVSHPGYGTMLCMLRLPIMMRSGLARTTNSGFRRGNGPSDAGTMFFTPRRVSVSPMNDDSPAP